MDNDTKNFFHIDDLASDLNNVDSNYGGVMEDSFRNIKSREVNTPNSVDSTEVNTAKCETTRRCIIEAEENLDVSASFYWHSFLLISGRLFNRILDWYNSLFILSTKDKIKIFRNLSQYYLKCRTTDKAMYYLKEWVKIEKNNPEPFYQLGIIFSTLGEYQKAANAFNSVLRLKPNYPIAVYRKSVSLLKLKQFKEAIKDLEQIIIVTPDDPRAYYLLGLAYDSDGQLDKGIKAMSKAMELDPEEIKYHQHLGFMSVRRDNHKAAAEHFSKVMELERTWENELEEELI